MPARAEDIIVLFALCGPLLFTQTEPFAVWMLDELLFNLSCAQGAIASGFEEEAEVNDNSSKNYLSSNGGELQGKRGIWKETGQNGQDHLDARDDNGMK